jgi:hypothetical protein
MAGRRLTTRELNRALLARQGLLERAATPLPRMLERMGGLQAQYAPSMYVGLWSRVDGLTRSDVTTAIQKRSIIQATLMRITIHLVSRRDYWPIALAVRDARRKLWLRTRPEPIAEPEAEDAARVIEARLRESPEIHRKEIEELVGKPRAHGVGLWLDLVRVPPLGTWDRRRADLYGLASDWVGPPGDATAAGGVDLLVRRYLGAFGPAARTDVANWAGLPMSDVAPALDRIKLRTLRGPDDEELIDLPRAPLPDPDTPAPVRFLPHFDATLLAHARRTQILPEEYRPRIFHTKAPQSFATFLVDGQVAGTWKHADGRIEIDAFHKLDAGARRELAAESGRLAEFHA